MSIEFKNRIASQRFSTALLNYAVGAFTLLPAEFILKNTELSPVVGGIALLATGIIAIASLTRKDRTFDPKSYVAGFASNFLSMLTSSFATEIHLDPVIFRIGINAGLGLLQAVRSKNNRPNQPMFDPTERSTPLSNNDF